MHRGRQQFGGARLRADHHAKPARHRLHHDIAERLEERGQRERVGGAKKLLDLADRAQEAHARTDSKPMSHPNVAKRRTVGAGNQQVRMRFDRGPRLEQRSKSFACETVAHERDHRSAGFDLVHLTPARALGQAGGTEALEVNPVVKGHRLGRIDAELVD